MCDPFEKNEKDFNSQTNLWYQNRKRVTDWSRLCGLPILLAASLCVADGKSLIMWKTCRRLFESKRKKLVKHHSVIIYWGSPNHHHDINATIRRRRRQTDTHHADYFDSFNSPQFSFLSCKFPLFLLIGRRTQLNRVCGDVLFIQRNSIQINRNERIGQTDERQFSSWREAKEKRRKSSGLREEQ